jgi:hypothetical protein
VAKNGKSQYSGARPVRGRPPAPKKGASAALWLALGGLVVVIVGVFLIVRPGGAAAPAATPQVTGKPRLAVDGDKIDFGTVPLNKPVKATFKLTNVGDKTLVIEGEPEVQVLKGC